MAKSASSELQYDDDLARGLRRARLGAGFGFRPTCRKLEIATSSLYRFESGEIRPSLETLEKMLRLYGANLNVGPDGLMLTWLEEVVE
jgi:transcriptional regulator with XRE-family HTH domain